MADCFRVCSDLASAFRGLGFVGDISFHKVILYQLLIQKLIRVFEFP